MWGVDMQRSFNSRAMRAQISLAERLRATLRSLAIPFLLMAAFASFAQERVATVGYLGWQQSGPYEEATRRGFAEGLREEGYIEGRNLRILRRYADFDPSRFRPLAQEMSDAGVDVYFASATPMATAAWRASRSTPIVIATILDPVELEFVKSLARPGTRVTGVTTMNKELNGKRLQLLAEIIPGVKRVGVVIDEAMRHACAQEIDSLEAAAKALGLRLIYAQIDQAGTVDGAFRKLAADGAQAVITTLTSTRNGLEKEYAQAAIKYRLPSMNEMTYSARLGGLVSYGPDISRVFRRAGNYVGRILKGANPADMPIEQPSNFLMVVNTKTATALGIKVPQAILLRADEIIE